MPRKKQHTPAYLFPPSFFNQESKFKSLFYKPQASAVVEDQIITIEHFFSGDLCHELISSFGDLNLETTPLIKSKDYAARFNDRLSLTDYKAADALWGYLRAILLQDLPYDPDQQHIRAAFASARSLNPQLRIYRYTKGHHFGNHYDDLVTCPLAHDPSTQGHTKWTLLVYLTGGADFEGGGTVFHPENGQPLLNVHPSPGMALLHKHGDDCMRHEAELVRLGVKWVLRSDVTF